MPDAAPKNFLRACEPGWICISMHDPAGRRGLWFRRTSDGGVELCAGREGDDAWAKVEPDGTVRGMRSPGLDAIVDCLEYAAAAPAHGMEVVGVTWKRGPFIRRRDRRRR